MMRPGMPEDAEAVARVQIASWQEGYKHLFSDEQLSGISLPDRTRFWRRFPPIVAEVDEEVNSFVFLFVFLPLVVVAYFAIPAHRARLVLLVLASYVFYAYAKWWFALLMVASTLVGYAGGRALERTRSKAVLVATVASLLALLGAFKYAAFVG